MSQRKIWTLQDDKILKHLVQDKNMKKWSEISNIMAKDFKLFQRNGKQCRQRYLNHLAQNINKDQWTQEQELNLIQLHDQLGNKWSTIAKKLNGRQQINLKRTDNCVKNHFYSKMRRCIRQINNIIQLKLKKQFKPLKIEFIYKLVQFADQKYKQAPIVKPELFQESYGTRQTIIEIKKSILMLASILDANNQEEQHLQKVINLIKSINLFNIKNKKKLKRKLKKKKSEDQIDDQEIQKEKKKKEKKKKEKNNLNRMRKSDSQFQQENSSEEKQMPENEQQEQQYFQPYIDKIKQEQIGNNNAYIFSENGINQIFQQYIPEKQVKNQVSRLHSLSIQKQEGFQNIIKHLSEQSRQSNGLQFTRVDPFLHGTSYIDSSRNQNIPNILVEGQINQQMKTSRLRSFGSIEASVQYHNNTDSKFLDKQFLSKNQLQTFLASINSPNH